MNTWVEAPPPRQGMGCFGRGCLILGIFAVLLVIACIGGIYWGMRTQSAVARGIFWLAKVHAVDDKPVAVPEFRPEPAQMEAARERWGKFEDAVDNGESAEIVLTADDLNNLIARNHDLSGKAFATIQGNTLRFQVSVPLPNVAGRSGYYFNAEVVMQTDEPEYLDHPRFSRITVNGQSVPEDLLDWKYNKQRLRDYVAKYLSEYRTGSIQIRDGKLILRARAN